MYAHLEGLPEFLDRLAPELRFGLGVPAPELGFRFVVPAPELAEGQTSALAQRDFCIELSRLPFLSVNVC